jgi:hypothetical protein
VASSIVLAGRLRRILAAMSLGLPLIITAVPAMAAVRALPSEGWQFTGDDQSQEVRAVLNSGELNATIAFERDARRWSIALRYPDGSAPPGAVSLSAVYDADPSRNRPHRVEQLSLHPEPGESAAQPGNTLKLALPHTFILHLQGADRIEVEDGGRTVTIPLQGSAKAIAMIYAALGEARGGGGKTMTELVNDLGSSASSGAASNHQSTDVGEAASAEAKLEPTVPPAQPETNSAPPPPPGFNCELNDEISVDDFGACLQDRMAEIDDYITKVGDRPYFGDLLLSDTIKMLDGDEIVYRVSTYIKQKYPSHPTLVCNDIYMPYGMNEDRELAIQFFSDELKCLNGYRRGYLEDMREKYYSALDNIPLDYFGNKLNEKLDKIYNREDDRHRAFVDALKPRYREHFEGRKTLGLM